MAKIGFPAISTGSDPSTATLANTLVNPDNSGGDYFGQRVALSDNYAIVGAYGKKDGSNNASGAAYIYELSTGNLVHTLLNPNAYGTTTSDGFGDQVAITDTHAIVGAYSEDDAGGSRSGKAYIFDVATGNLLHTLNNPDPDGSSADDLFGSSVGIDGNYAIVAADQELAGEAAGSGKVYVYDVTTGNLVRTIDNANAYGTASGDFFGESIDIKGTKAIVGAYLEDDATNLSTGKVYVFDVTTGNLIHTISNPNAYDTPVNDRFGSQVAISNTHYAVGVQNEDDAGGGASGKVYVFDASNANLLYTLDNPNPYGTSSGDLFGAMVDLSDNHLIVGAYNEDSANNTNEGKVYIYDLSDGSLINTVDNPSPSTGSDRFGIGAAINNTHFLVGAAYWDDNTAGTFAVGQAYLFSSGSGSGYSGIFTDANGRQWEWNNTASTWDLHNSVDVLAAPTESLTDISQLTDSSNLLDAAGRISTVITNTAGLNGIATPAAGRLAYEDTADRMYVYNGTDWRILHDENNPQFQPFDLIATGTDGDSFANSTQYVFNNDGTEVTGMGGGSSVATYALDTAYDVFNVSTRNSLRSKTIPGHAYAFVYGIAFNGDGTKIFITDAEDGGTTGREINTFTLSTAYDISTMSASATATDNLYTVSGGASGEVEGLHFNANGTKMFTWDQNGRRVIEWSLSSAYTPSSASIIRTLTPKTVIENSGHSGNVNSIFSGNFNADGTRLYVADFSGVVYLIRLSTGFDLSTATHTQGELFDLTSYAEYPSGITLNADETVLTVRAQGLSPATGNLYQFLVPTT